MNRITGIVNYPSGKVRPNLAGIASAAPSGTMGDAYRLIFAAAEAGKPCPTNEALAVAMGCESPWVGQKVVGQLEEAGWITVERFNKARVATIKDTGKSTARPKNPTPHWRKAAGGAA